MPLRSDAPFGLGLVMLAAALWATVGVAVQMTPGAAAIPDSLLAALRTGIAGPTLLMFWAFGTRDRLSRLRGLSLRPLAVFALSSALFQICLFRSFAQLGVTVAVFLTVCLPPVLAWTWAALRGAEGLTRHATLALALAVVGIALVSTTEGGGGTVIGVSGLANAVLAAAAFVAMSLAANQLARRLPAPLVAGAGLSLSAVVLLAVALVSGARVQAGLADVSLVRLGALVAYLGLLPTALAYLCYCAGISRCRTPVVGLVASMIEPLLAAILAALLLGERILPSTTAGCAVLMAAMVLLWESERRSARSGHRGAGRPAPEGAREQTGQEAIA